MSGSGGPPGGAVILHEVANGVRIRLRVKPGGRVDRLIGPHDGALKLEVRAAPERGRANDAVDRLLADRLGLSRSDVDVVAGRSSQDKTVAVSGVSAVDVGRRLQAAGVPAAVIRDRS